MIISKSIENHIAKKLITSNEERELNHTSSGKLSASMLGWPLQWQILKNRGIKGDPFDAYTLAKFKRGIHVEDWLLKEMEEMVVQSQEFVEYRDAIGYLDALVDTKDWDFPVGIIPLEVKSVTNLKFKRLLKEGAQRSHKLQAGFYAVAKGTEQYAITYVASDDYRTLTLIYETEEVKQEINDIIERYNKQVESGVTPEFVAEEKWQENPQYNNYPTFMGLTEEEIQIKLKEI